MSVLQRGVHDPCWRWRCGTLWWATRALGEGAIVALQPQPRWSQVAIQAWGPAAPQLTDQLPQLLGDMDDGASEFRPLPQHPALVAAWRQHRHWRMPRTTAVFESLAAAILEQKVTGNEAYRAWGQLTRAYGDPAPGPAGAGLAPTASPDHPAAGMRLPLTPAQWLAIGSWEFLRAGVDASRRSAVLAAARVADRLEATVGTPGPQAAAMLQTVSGVGVWTAAEVRQRAHGDPDAFSWNDFHVAKDVSWALCGRVLDDAGCAQLLEPYRGHRYRVQRLLALAGIRRPRRGPRMRLPEHLPV